MYAPIYFRMPSSMGGELLVVSVDGLEVDGMKRIFYMKIKFERDTVTPYVQRVTYLNVSTGYRIKAILNEI